MKRKLTFFAVVAALSLATLVTSCAHSRDELVTLPEYNFHQESYEGAPCIFIENTNAYPGNSKAASIIKRELEERGVTVMSRKNIAAYQDFKRAKCVLCVHTVMERISEKLNDDTFARDVLLVVSVSNPGSGGDVLGDQDKVYFSAWSRDFLEQEVKYRPYVMPSADLSFVVKNLIRQPAFQQQIMACNDFQVLDPVPFSNVVSNEKENADKSSQDTDSLTPNMQKRTKATKKNKAASEKTAKIDKSSIFVTSKDLPQLSDEAKRDEAIMLEYQKKTNEFTQKRDANLKELMQLQQQMQNNEISVIEYQQKLNVLLKKIQDDLEAYNKYIQDVNASYKQ